MPYFSIPSFLLSTSCLSISILFIFLIRAVVKNHISIFWQYKVWYIMLFLLWIPLVPSAVILPSVFHWTPKLLTEGNAFFSPLYSDISSSGTIDWKNNYAVSVTASLDTQNTVLFYFWLAGAVIFMCLFIAGLFQLYRIKADSKNADDRLQQLLINGCARLSTEKKFLLRISKTVKSPMIFGLWRPIIVLPESVCMQMSEEEITYILYHELMHYKNRDILVNYLTGLFRIFYWYNPIVWIAFRQMAADRELACDRAVLELLSKEKQFAYGLTILHFIEHLSQTKWYSVASDMGGTKKQIQKRIEGIALFSKETMWLKIKSRLIFLLILGMSLLQIPFLTAFRFEENSSHKEKNIVKEDLSRYFNGYQGSFVLFDLEKEQYTIYNEEQSRQRISPNSTYKIYSALIALEKGSITPENTVLKWNGQQNPIPKWNQDQTLQTAMAYSVNWYFQALDQQSGFSAIKQYLTQMQYGNCDFSGGEARFWLQSSLKISPLEQVALLSSFYKQELPFQKENMDIVKNALRLSEKNETTLYGKTGTAEVNGKITNGWFIGFVEQKGHVSIFAVAISGENDAGGSQAADIALSILQEKGIYEN